MSREVIFELYRVGNTTKVTAVDPGSMTEVSIVAPATWNDAALRRAALRKLEFVLAKQRGDASKAGRSDAV